MTNLDSNAFVFFGATGDLAFKQIFPALQAMIRGVFYEEVGAIRDVVQNHMLEVVALLTMEAPIGHDPDALRDGKQRALRGMCLHIRIRSDAVLVAVATEILSRS